MKGYIVTILLGIALLFSMCRKKMIGHEPAEEILPLQYELQAVPTRINAAFGGYYLGLPPQYHENTDSVPLLFFLHGLGQMGNGQDHLPYLLYDGIGKLLKDNRLPTSFKVNGEDRSFIIVSPQFSTQPSVDEVMQVLDHICTNYRVDRHRIYLAGLSLGAKITTLVAAEYPYKFAAIIPISGVAITPGLQDRCRMMSEAKLPVWQFHNNEDPLSNVNDTKRFINYLFEFDPEAEVKLTIFDTFGHDAWTAALDPFYKEDGSNIYEWMLQFSR